MLCDKAMKKDTGVKETTLFLENDINAIDAVVQTIVKAVDSLIDNEEIHTVSIGITEMLINAIEHGNLELSYQEKTQLLDDESYYDELKRRKQLPRYKDRKVGVRFTVNDESLTVCIQDDGKGFDWRGLPPTRDRVTDVHGRGICMTRYYFDEVHFNDKGNEVTLVKKFSHD